MFEPPICKIYQNIEVRIWVIIEFLWFKVKNKASFWGWPQVACLSFLSELNVSVHSRIIHALFFGVVQLVALHLRLELGAWFISRIVVRNWSSPVQPSQTWRITQVRRDLWTSVVDQYQQGVFVVLSNPQKTKISGVKPTSKMTMK